MTFGEAIVQTIAEEMKRDSSIFMIGENIIHGVYIDYAELAEKFSDRLVRAPICEETIVGTAIGAALNGLRPIVDLHYNDFMLRAMDQIVNEMAKIQYVSGGQTRLPLTIRTMINTGVPLGKGMGANHAQNFSPLFMHIPGLQVVMPATAYDAKGLLRTAIRGNNPVLFFEHAALYSQMGSVPEGDYTLPFGQATVRREGKHVTVIPDVYMLGLALQIAPSLQKQGIDIEVIDLRTLVPLDKKTIFDSIKKTNRLVIAEQGPKTGGMGAEISAIVCEECFDSLKAPIRRVGAKDAPIPASSDLEMEILPNEQDLMQAIKAAVA